jgi:hypothetical protein
MYLGVNILRKRCIHRKLLEEIIEIKRDVMSVNKRSESQLDI